MTLHSSSELSNSLEGDSRFNVRRRHGTSVTRNVLCKYMPCVDGWVTEDVQLVSSLTWRRADSALRVLDCCSQLDCDVGL